MNLNKLILTKNNCYKAGRTITVKGLMLHSSGANNPDLKRYVGPDDGKLGVNQHNNHWNQATPGGQKICCHGFIGKLKDGTVASYQTLPWNHRGWHCGVGKNGSGNNTHIGIEVCEGDLTDKIYFSAIYQEAVELFAFLCKKYNLNPTADGVIIDHAEGHKRGIASNHADITHWFKNHGKTMDDFRKAVKEAMSGNAASQAKPSKTSSIAPPAPMGMAVGDIVYFGGKTHYKTASAANGSSCTPGFATVTSVAEGTKHPYHLVKMANSTGTVHGWVSAKLVYLKLGCQGKSTAWIQEKLIATGNDPGSVDGIFGPKTDKAVRDFQKAKKLVQDGIVGEKTLWALLKY